MGNTYNTGEGTNYTPSTIKLKIEKEHERIICQTEHEYEVECKKLDQKYELDVIDKNLGLIGRTFGNVEHASKNITAIICLCLILGVAAISIIVYLDQQDIDFIRSMWLNISPIITLSLGYLFGKK